MHQTIKQKDPKKLNGWSTQKEGTSFLSKHQIKILHQKQISIMDNRWNRTVKSKDIVFLPKLEANQDLQDAENASIFGLFKCMVHLKQLPSSCMRWNFQVSCASVWGSCQSYHLTLVFSTFLYVMINLDFGWNFSENYSICPTI